MSAVLLSCGLFATAASAGALKSLLGAVGGDVSATVSATVGGSDSGSNASADINVGGGNDGGSNGIGDLLNDTTNTVGDLVNRSTDAVGNTLDGTTDRLGNTLDTAVATVNDTAGKATDATKQVLARGKGTLEQVLGRLLEDGHTVSLAEVTDLVGHIGHYVSASAHAGLQVADLGANLDFLADGSLDTSALDDTVAYLDQMLQSADWSQFSTGRAICLPKSAMVSVAGSLSQSDYSGLTQVVGANAGAIASLQHGLANCHGGGDSAEVQSLTPAQIKRVVGFDVDGQGQPILFMM